MSFLRPINQNFRLTPQGGSSVAGPSPASSTDNAIVRWDGTAGSLVQNSTVTVDDNGGISTTIADTGNTVGFTVVQNDVTNNPRAISITNAGTANAVLIDQNGNNSQSNSVGGALLIEMTGSTGAGLVIYSNHATSTRRLFQVKADNTGYGTQVAQFTQDGTSHCVSIVQNSTGTSANALVITSVNPNDTTVGIS